MKNPIRLGRSLLSAFGVVGLFCVTAPLARADQTYTFTGNLFQNFNLSQEPQPPGVPLTGPGTYACSNGVGECSISGSITLNQALAPNSFVFGTLAFGMGTTTIPTIQATSFNFTDGVNSITNTSTVTETNAQFQTDANGNIVAWDIALNASDPLNSDNLEFVTQGGGFGIGGCHLLMSGSALGTDAQGQQIVTCPNPEEAYDESSTFTSTGSLIGDATVENAAGTWITQSSNPTGGGTGGGGGTSTVPEPSSVVLLGSGLLGFAVNRRRISIR